MTLIPDYSLEIVPRNHILFHPHPPFRVKLGVWANLRMILYAGTLCPSYLQQPSLSSTPTPRFELNPVCIDDRASWLYRVSVNVFTIFISALVSAPPPPVSS